MHKTPIATIDSIDGNALSVFGYEMGDGEKAVYIQGGMHGGEITYWIFHSLAKQLQLKKLKKRIILVPISNPFSWQQKSYFYTVGKFSFIDGKDWLWSFPGSSNGTPMQRLAHQLFGTAAEYSLSIDLHTSRKSVPFGIFSSDKYQQEANALGIAYNFVSTYGDSPEQYKQGVASLSYAMTMSGKRGFTLECGSHDDFHAENIENMTNSILNLLRWEGVIEEPVKHTSKLITFTDDEFGKYRATETGFVEYLKYPGESYSKGDILFSILDSSDINRSVQVHADEQGIVLKISPTHIAQAGDVVMEVIRQK